LLWGRTWSDSSAWRAERFKKGKREPSPSHNRGKVKDPLKSDSFTTKRNPEEFKGRTPVLKKGNGRKGGGRGGGKLTWRMGKKGGSPTVHIPLLRSQQKKEEVG